MLVGPSSIASALGSVSKVASDQLEGTCNANLVLLTFKLNFDFSCSDPGAKFSAPVADAVNVDRVPPLIASPAALSHFHALFRAKQI